MALNIVYCRRESGASKRIFATVKSKIDVMKFSNTIQLISITGFLTRPGRLMIFLCCQNLQTAL
jgi:hypothetical protein